MMSWGPVGIPLTTLRRLLNSFNVIFITSFRFLRRLERSLKMRESYPALSDDEGDESSSVTSPLLQTRKDLREAGHAISAPLLGAVRPKITRQRRYDRSLVADDTKILNAATHDNSD